MRCIFCKNHSDNSKSVEHIVPEALGNKSHYLPAGIVCDSCNNYFGTKVEKMFLESGSITALRFTQLLESKKGHLPAVDGIVLPDMPVKIHRRRGEPLTVDVPTNIFQRLLTIEKGELAIPTFGKEPDHFVVSRLLAKMALETMASRLVLHAEGLDYLVNERQLDPIRNHARYGKIAHWPFHSRRIYEPDRLVSEKQPLQTLFEYDLLYTKLNELYFVIAIFGHELAINCAGPEVEGYVEWLEESQGISPLYFGKNATPPE